MADIYQIKLPSGSIYNLRDSRVDTITGALTFLGVADTTGDTKISENSTTNPVIVGGVSKTALAGSVVVQGGLEFVFDGTKWHQLGDESSYELKSALGNFAYANSGTGTYKKSNANTGNATLTPSGTVEASFTGTQDTVSASYQPKGSVAVTPTITITGGTFKKVTAASLAATPAFTGTTATISVSGNSNVSVSNHSYTPEGTVTVTPSVTLNTTTIYQITGVGSAASHGADSYTPTAYTVNDGLLTITAGSFTSGTFNGGSAATRDPVTVGGTTVKSATATASFSGTAATISHSVTNGQATFTGSYTPEGTVSKPNITLTSSDQSYTNTVSAISATASFTGTTATISHTYTPAGSITATFTGKAATHSHSVGTTDTTISIAPVAKS